MSGKRQLNILSCFQNNQLPKKVARSEDTVEEAVEETVEEVEEAVEETGENPLETEKRRGLCGAATYRCSFKKEWSTRWPFITMGTTSSFYWCSVCRQENSCAHQGVRDISRHVEGKGHRAKEQPLNSVSSIAQFYVPETSVGGMSVQEAKENGSIYIHGCPCHIIHNTAKHAGQKFMEISGFDPEDLTVDVGYWFKGSTNRKGYLAEFCEFHESEYMEMLLHISVRWLSLERCITRILRQYGPLTSYFKSLNEKQPRFRRLVDAFSNPLTEVYLLFYQATLPVFTILNLLLQRERSSIFQLHGEMTKFIKKLCARFMKPSALQGRQVHDILYKDPLNQLPGEKLNVGFTTRATLNRLLEAGDITPQEVQLFQQATLAFLVRAVEYGINKLPLKEALLRHTRCVDVQQRTECGVEDALYFIDRFQELLPFHGPEEQDKVCEEFLEYQRLDIPMPQDPTTFNVEEFWGSMSSIKCKVTDKTTVPTQSPAAAKISL
ncbi:Protein FAM200A [Dissostichus eleginoides]|uniref:Protein FAM200A n=1 Tax=Dissostichus eleginoides TaxID=100907 RepID=A0AAD9CB00_DISEL|nr:Protein FAM200A [Dissostichus eleginoides]